MAAEYNMGQNYISSTKINYFHYVLKHLSGYTIHPSIDVSDRPCRVADLGTQTAIWPIDVVENSFIPMQVEGFDISNKFFPPPSWIPENVKLRIHDILQPFPREFIEQFDIVHIRLFLNLPSSKIAEIVKNATTLLRPGGFIQWTEHDKSGITPTAASPGHSMAATEAFIALQQEPFPNYDARWILDIGPTMASNGLTVIAEDRIKVRNSLLQQMNELHLLSLMDVPEGLSRSIDEFRDRHLQSLVQEYANGVSAVDGFICVVGKKPEKV